MGWGVRPLLHYLKHTLVNICFYCMLLFIIIFTLCIPSYAVYVQLTCNCFLYFRFVV